MREIRTSGLMSGERKRSDAHRAQATAPLLDSTKVFYSNIEFRGGLYEGLERGSAEAGMFTHAGTYHGHPVPAAVALQVLKLFEEHDILGHVQRMAAPFAKVLSGLAAHSLLASQRAVGLVGALDLVAPTDKGDVGTLGAHLGVRCEANGLFVRPVADSVVLAPPLVITAGEIEEMFCRFAHARALDETGTR